MAKEEGTYEGSIPLVTFGALTAAIIAVFTIASGAIILVPTFLLVDRLDRRDRFHGDLQIGLVGHGPFVSQQINMAAQVSPAGTLVAADDVLGAKPLSEKVSRTAFLLYILFLQLASRPPFVGRAGGSVRNGRCSTPAYALYLAVLGSMIHGMSLPGAVEAAQRRNGFVKGAFEWLRKAPWGNPAFSSMAMSVVFFGFLGGISGVVMGVEQINILIHNTIYVPGHFHGTVVAGTTLAFMGITYAVVPLIWQREIVWKGLAKWQPYMFGAGAAGISVFMMGAGIVGVSRRHWDINFADATLKFDYAPIAHLMLGLNGLAAILAALGGLAFILIVVMSIFFGAKRDAAAVKANPTVVQGTPVAKTGSEGTMKLPGTIILVAVFFITFVIYYFVNWKFLSDVWPLR